MLCKKKLEESRQTEREGPVEGREVAAENKDR